MKINSKNKSINCDQPMLISSGFRIYALSKIIVINPLTNGCNREIVDSFTE